MRKVLSLLIIPVLLAGCAKVQETELHQDQEGLHEVVFHAGWDPETRTVLQEDGSVWWSPGEKINLFAVVQLDVNHWDTAIETFVSTNSVAAPRTDFVGHIQTSNDATYYAVYPYNPDPSAWDRYVSVTIPTIQTAIAGSFDPAAFVSYAVAQGNNLYFKNVCGGVKFSVSQEGIKAVTFKYTSGDIMSGRLYIDVNSEDSPSIYTWDTRSDEVTVQAPEGSYFEVGKYYYAVMFPTDSDQPMMVTYKKDSSQANYLTKGHTTIKRSVFKRLYNKDENLSFETPPPRKDGAVMMSMNLDRDVRAKITEVYFHPSSNYVTDVNLGTSDRPVYFEMNGTIVHYYTPLEYFNVKNVTNQMFGGCRLLKKVDLSGVDTSEATDFTLCFSGCRSLKSLDLSNFDTSSAVVMESMFSGCDSIESLDLSSFSTSLVYNMSGLVGSCRKLKELNLSSFDTRNCTDMTAMFSYCGSLQRLDLANFDVSAVNKAANMCYKFALRRKHCDVRASDATRALMCGDDAQMPQEAKDYYVTWIAPNEEFPPFEDPFEGFYESTDYSKDKTHRTVQTATQGKGIDIVLMGDAYSDRLIENGKYDDDLNNAIEQIFSEEPLRSLRAYFNVYISYAVSEHESIEGVTAFDLVYEGEFSSTIKPYEGWDLTEDYMKEVLPDYGWEELTGRPIPYIIIISNSNRHAGTTYFYDSGSTLVLSPLGLDDTDFHAIICHEFGHALGRLADEYDDWYGHLTFGDIPSDVDEFTQRCSKGFWPNVDITNDPYLVKWRHFLSDERYSNQGLGIFEGGFAQYAYGIWRPTENSIMNSATTGFNAPCREAVYKRVRELAEDSFEYDYETFVAFDQNAKAEAARANRAPRMTPERILPHLSPPVFIQGTGNPYGACSTLYK